MTERYRNKYNQNENTKHLSVRLRKVFLRVRKIVAVVVCQKLVM
jgi:hypothetical protein